MHLAESAVPVPTQKWHYAWRGKRLDTIFGTILIAAGTCVALSALIAPFGLLGPTLQDRMIDSVPVFVAPVLLLFCFFVLYIALKETMQYMRKYETNQDRIEELYCFFRKKISWSDVIEVNRLIEPARDAYMNFVNRKGLWIASRTDWIIVYEELEGYDEFRALVNSHCKAHNVPMFERDSSWEVANDKKRWRAAKRVARRSELRGRLNGFEERPIDEL